MNALVDAESGRRGLGASTLLGDRGRAAFGSLGVLSATRRSVDSSRVALALPLFATTLSPGRRAPIRRAQSRTCSTGRCDLAFDSKATPPSITPIVTRFAVNALRASPRYRTGRSRSARRRPDRQGVGGRRRHAFNRPSLRGLGNTRPMARRASASASTPSSSRGRRALGHPSAGATEQELQETSPRSFARSDATVAPIGS